MKRTLLLLSTLTLLPGGVGQARADFIVNGGFETVDFTGWTLSGDTSFTNVVDKPGVAHSGDAEAFLGTSGSLGFLSQTFTDPNPGELLTLTFFLRDDVVSPNVFEAIFNGVTVFDQTDIPDANYVSHTFTVAASSSNTLQLGFRDDGSFLLLDDVSMVPAVSGVPEPSTLTLLGIGAVGLLAHGWRRRK